MPSRYPAPLFTDLAALASLAPSSAVLEIGCGTGQATVPIAKRAGKVVAVELGSDMAAVCGRKALEAGVGDKVEVNVGPFEEWTLPTEDAEKFDLVVAATSWHWLDPDLRMSKSADALKPGGKLAVIFMRHVAGGTRAFYADVQPLYRRFDSTIPIHFRIPETTVIPQAEITEEFEKSGRFDKAVVRRYEWEVEYSKEEYVDFLGTFSDHRAMPREKREELFRAVGELVDRKYAGRITEKYMAQLAIALVKQVGVGSISRPA
jgi:SAM-dependent methyltransferase